MILFYFINAFVLDRKEIQEGKQLRTLASPCCIKTDQRAHIMDWKMVDIVYLNQTGMTFYIPKPAKFVCDA